MDVPYGMDEFNQALLETVAANKLDACYIRPLIYRGYGQLGVNPFPCPVDVAIMVWDWGKYLGTEALEKGVDVRVSSWTRIAPNTLPAMAKTVGQLHELAAHQDGGDQERLRRGHRARLTRATSPRAAARTSSWSRRASLITPPLVSSVLPGITRDTVITLARRLGIPVARSS